VSSAYILLRDLLTALARWLRRPAAAPQLLPIEVVLASEDEGAPAPRPVTIRLQPPPIPAAARRAVVATGSKASDQERAWQELMNGRHPGLILRSLARG
jgi:hypothetical protein